MADNDNDGGEDCVAIMTAIKMVPNPLTEHFNNLARWLSGAEKCTKCTWAEQWLQAAMSLSKRPANSNSTTDTETMRRIKLRKTCWINWTHASKNQDWEWGGKHIWEKMIRFVSTMEHKNSCDMWLFLFCYVYEDIFAWRSHTVFAVFLHRVHKNVLSTLACVFCTCVLL